MNRFLTTISVVTLFSGLSLVATAQDKSKDKPTGSYESKSTNTTTTDSGTTKTTTDKIYGKVEEYQPGKTLKISTPGKTEGTKSYDLSVKDATFHTASNLKVGDWVAVTEKTDNHGHKVTTISHSKHAARAQ